MKINRLISDNNLSAVPSRAADGPKLAVVSGAKGWFQAARLQPSLLSSKTQESARSLTRVMRSRVVWLTRRSIEWAVRFLPSKGAAVRGSHKKLRVPLSFVEEL
jgi:hypothetical protein